LKQLFQKLNEACRIANNHELSELERNRAKLSICHDSLFILNSEVQLLNDIKAELQYAIDSQKFSEVILQQLAGIVILMLTNIPIPTTEFSLQKEYNHFLYSEVKPGIESLVQIRAVIENELEQAKNTVEDGILVEKPTYTPTLFTPPVSPKHDEEKAVKQSRGCVAF